MIGPRRRVTDRVRAFRPGLGSALVLVAVATGLWAGAAAYSDYRAVNARLAAAIADRDAFLQALRP